MNSDPENFDSLRRLLALKRHEQPPPGYFNDFSRRVIARIEASESDAPAGRWWSRFWSALETKPIVAGGFGAAVCAAVIMGILNSEMAPVASVSPVLVPEMANRPAAMALNTMDTPNFVPVASNDVHSLFEQFQLTAQPVSVTFGLPQP